MSEQSPDSERLEARLQDLEGMAGFQERAVQKLNEVVLELFGKVEELERELERIRSEKNQPEFGPHDDQPPHY